MKRISNILTIYSLSVLSMTTPAFAAETIAFIPPERAETTNPYIVTEEQFATIPTLEGGVTAVIGTFYAVPSADNTNYTYSRPSGTQDFTSINSEADYDFGFEAALGYVFKNSAQSVELAFRDLNTSDTNGVDNISQGPSHHDVSSDIDYHLRTVDLMFGQFVDLGQLVQMRFVAGLSYAELKREQSSDILELAASRPVDIDIIDNNDYKGVGPRIGVDARYDFGQGFGIVGSGSLAYFLGKLDNDYTFTKKAGDDPTETTSISDHVNNQAVMNFRGNVGIDYVYFFEDVQRSTIGIEFGYLIDYYDNAIANTDVLNLLIPAAPVVADYDATVALSFSGPYLNLKAVF